MIDDSGLTRDRFAYRQRLDAYLRGDPVCGIRGRDHARCVLEPGHPGDYHEGGGFDDWGPKYVCWVVG